MKWIIALIMAFSLATLAQNQLEVIPRPYGPRMIVHTAGDYKTVTTVDTSRSFPLRQIQGSLTNFVEFDTTTGSAAAALPDTCMSIKLQIKILDSEWSDFYGYIPVYTSDASIGVFSGGTIDTVARSVINKAPGSVYINLPLSYAWAPGDSARLIYNIGSGNIGKLKSWVQGQ